MIPRALLLLLGLVMMGGAFAAAAQDTSPAGLWRTLDDKSGQPRAEISISVTNGIATGRIVRSLRPGDDPAARCTQCPGSRQGQPFQGLTILTGLRPDKNQPRRWSGGEILDPETGTVYRVRVEVAADGQTLEVRGFVGVALLGRTQVWQRIQPGS